VNVRVTVLAGAGATAGMFVLAAAPVWADALVGAVSLGAAAALTLAVTSHLRSRLVPLWIVVALGAALQLRLGVDATMILLIVCGSAVAFVVVALVGPAVMRQDSPEILHRLGIGLLASALVARAGTALLGDLQSGGLDLWFGSIQIGELTRIMVVIGAGLLIGDLARPIYSRIMTRHDRFAALIGGGLLSGNVLLLAVVDSGPALLVTCAVLVMLLVANAPYAVRATRRYGGRLAAGILLLAGASFALVWSTSIGERLSARWADVLDPGYQLSIALHALQTGGFIGLGIGSSPSADSIPAARSDYLPIVLGADLGIGALITVVALLLIVCGSLVATATATQVIGPWRLASAGLVAALFGQILMSGFGVIGVIPLSGVSMSFLTVTGSATLACFLSLGVLEAALRTSRTPAPVATPGPPQWSARPTTRVTAAPRLAVACAAAFAVCGVVLASIAPAASVSALLDAPRGDILTSDGVVIATTDADGVRRYPQGPLYTGIAYLKPGYAAYGVEASAGADLGCGGRPEIADIILQVVRPLPCTQADVVTTLHDGLQRALADMLAGRRGSAVVLDSWTGAVLGLYSTDQLAPEAIALDQLPPSEARTGSASPGSTFKLIIASSALVDSVDASGSSTTLISVDGEAIENNGDFTCPDLAIVTMLAVSCNTTAATLALRVGQTSLQDVAARYFDADGTFPFDGGPVSAISTGLDGESLAAASLARTGYGQESVQASPVALAAATAVIAKGVGPAPLVAAPRPHVVAGVCTGETDDAPRRAALDPEMVADPTGPIGEPLSAGVAGSVFEGMRMAVESGTARALQPDSDRWDIAAKTGTAQVPEEVSSTGLDGWVTLILDSRWVVTVQVHDAAPDAELNPAVEAASELLYSLPDITPDGGKKC